MNNPNPAHVTFTSKQLTRPEAERAAYETQQTILTSQLPSASLLSMTRQTRPAA